MTGPVPRLPSAVLTAAAMLALAACSGGSLGNFGTFAPGPPLAPAAVTGPAPKPSIAPEEVVGRWGLASFHRPEDRARTEVAARGHCKQPYVINRSSTGVAMLGHDSPRVQDMTVKASAEGKTYIGPGSEVASADDREVVSFDGRVLVLKWVDPEVAGRYGTMVLVRCAPRA